RLNWKSFANRRKTLNDCRMNELFEDVWKSMRHGISKYLAADVTSPRSSRRKENTNSKTEQHEANELAKAYPLPIRSGEGSRERGSVHWQAPYNFAPRTCQ